MLATRWLVIVLLLAGAVRAAESTSTVRSATPAERGYRCLTTKAYMPPDFNEAVFAELWRTWEEPSRTQAESASPRQRRRMTFVRYGLTSAPDDTSGKPQQYVVDDQGNWTMNCLACHQGQVARRVIPGLPNSLFALATLTDDVRVIKQQQHLRPARMESGSLYMPLGTSRGTTNAVMFGVVLLAQRDADLNVLPLRLPPPMVHHDHDAPAWWHLKRKQRMYVDNFVTKGHRALMQFILVRENGPEKFLEWENDFRDIMAYIESLEPPRYPLPIDQALASKGRVAFDEHCARCHGNYGPDGNYPEKVIPIGEIGTDRVRFDSLSADHRAAFDASWFTEYGRKPTVLEPVGYLAPPLDGIWATAPYFHNGSVPTLWHVLHPDQRPRVWRRSLDGYFRNKVGIEVETFDRVPAEARSAREKREYFDTGAKGKSAAGHRFPDELDETEKHAVLEYLKML